MINKRKPTHPGELLREDVIKPLNISVTDAAKCLGITRKALSEFINCKSSLSTDMAIRLSKATNTSVESWMKMQMKLDIWEAAHKSHNIVAFEDMLKKDKSCSNFVTK